MIQLGDGMTVEIHAGEGFRMVMRDGMCVCSDGHDAHDRAAVFLAAATPLTGKSVAWIGGGMCVGPRLFSLSNCAQTVYEIEPALAEFCPEGIKFVPGDWRTTLSSTYDLIIYDLGEDVPTAALSQFLSPNGLILPAEEAS